MLKYVHHVHYLVRDLDQMVKYLEKNFGHEPDHQAKYGDHDIKALYSLGKTTIEISQPLDPESNQGKVLATQGPGVYHVAWAVDNIQQVAKDLTAKGNKLRGKNGITDSPHGYQTINIDPASSLGVWFQLAEGESRAQNEGAGGKRGVFQYVQQVEYNVASRDEMVAYLERNFGMKPNSLEENVRGEWKEAQYCVDETLLRIREPVPGTRTAKRFFAKHGPGIRIVAWGTEDNIADVAKKLRANGNTFKDKQRGFHQSSQGTEQIDIDPQDSLGLLLQVIERPKLKVEPQKGVGMLKGLHHIHYLIRNRDQMVAYMERTFGMKPDRLLEDEGGEWKEVQYFVGPAIIKMTEHAPGTKQAKLVEERGPGVHHVYWGVENITEAARELQAKGTKLLGTEEQNFRDGFRSASKSPHGYYEAYIDPKDSLGIEFRIVHAPKTMSIDIARAPK